jgi:hypothetical protein
VAVETAPMTFRAEEGRGAFSIDGIVRAEFEPIAPLESKGVTLRDTAFSTVQDAPAYAAKTSHYEVRLPQHQMKWAFEGHNAIQTAWRTKHAG